MPETTVKTLKKEPRSRFHASTFDICELGHVIRPWASYYPPFGAAPDWVNPLLGLCSWRE